MYALVMETLGRPSVWREVQVIDGILSITGHGVVVITPASGDKPKMSWLAGWYAVETLAMKKSDHRMSICADCAVWAANHDDSGSAPGWAERVVDRRSEIGALVVGMSDEHNLGFCKTSCDACGDPHDGNRYRATARA